MPSLFRSTASQVIVCELKKIIHCDKGYFRLYQNHLESDRFCAHLNWIPDWPINLIISIFRFIENVIPISEALMQFTQCNNFFCFNYSATVAHLNVFLILCSCDIWVWRPGMTSSDGANIGDAVIGRRQQLTLGTDNCHSGY